MEKLGRDWKTEPTLRIAAFENVEDLAQQLLQTHKWLMGDGSGLVGYLYQQQVKRLKETGRIK